MIVSSFIIQANVITIVKSMIVNVYSTGHTLRLEGSKDSLTRDSSVRAAANFNVNLLTELDFSD
jgi:hypothetical protein